PPSTLFPYTTLFRSLAARRRDHVVPVFLEDPRQGTHQRLVVVGDENLGGGFGAHGPSILEQRGVDVAAADDQHGGRNGVNRAGADRKSTRLNSSHSQ